MTRRLLYEWILTAYLLIGCSLPVLAQAPGAAAWRSTSMYSNQQATTTYSAPRRSSWGYTPAHNKISAYNSDFGRGAQLSSYFSSSSADARLSDYAPDGGFRSGARRSWGSPEDEDPIGEIAAVPIGEPLILLLLALLYVARMTYKKRHLPG